MSELTSNELRLYLQWQLHQYDIWCWLKSEELGFDIHNIFSNEALIMAYLYDHAQELHDEYDFK